MSIENFDEAHQNQCVGEAGGQPVQMLERMRHLKVNIMSVVGAEQIRLAVPAAAPQRRVLLADADETNAMFEAAALELLGWTVVRVRDGSSAVALATAGMFDLVLIEFRMPLLDGVEATRAIRRFEETSVRPRLPIVALTASVMPHEIEGCTEAGVDEVLGKPFTLAGMQRALERWGTRSWVAATGQSGDARTIACAPAGAPGVPTGAPLGASQHAAALRVVSR